MSNRFLEFRSENTEGDYDEIDDDLFLRSFRTSNHDRLSGSELDNRSQMLHERKTFIENRIVQSTEKSLGALYQSEQTGMRSAEELLRQREKLEMADQRLTNMNETLKQSQKQINGIKSVFSSFRNYFASKKEPAPKPDVPSPSQLSTDSNMNAIKIASGSTTNACDYQANQLQTTVDRSSTEHSPTSEFQRKLDSNLGEMASVVQRLRGLAEGMSVELSSQNKLIDSLNIKSEHVDIQVRSQNEQMKDILRK